MDIRKRPGLGESIGEMPAAISSLFHSTRWHPSVSIGDRRNAEHFLGRRRRRDWRRRKKNRVFTQLELFAQSLRPRRVYAKLFFLSLSLSPILFFLSLARKITAAFVCAIFPRNINFPGYLARRNASSCSGDNRLVASERAKDSVALADR